MMADLRQATRILAEDTGGAFNSNATWAMQHPDDPNAEFSLAETIQRDRRLRADFPKCEYPQFLALCRDRARKLLQLAREVS